MPKETERDAQRRLRSARKRCKQKRSQAGVRFREEEQQEETRAHSTMSGLEEVTTGRGRTSPIQGEDEGKKLELISVEICCKKAEEK